MRILKVSGENIASLKNFEFDFDKLSQSGVFAITGPTGAGKSTILDAILIALYNNAPRYNIDGAKGTKNTLKAKNTGNIISKGETKGHITVEIYDNQEHLLEVTWDGNLKETKNGELEFKYKRTLYDKDAETPVIEGTTNVQKAIDDHLQLNYEQFTKSVMLPQGQFSSFLEAKPSERGELLRKISGDDIYYNIIQKLGEKKAEFDSEDKEYDFSIKEKEQKLLPKDEMAKKQNEFLAIDSEIKNLNAITKNIDNWSNKLTSYLDSVKNEKSADNKHKQAELALQNLIPTEERIKKYDNAISKKSVYDSYIKSEKDFEDNQNNIQICLKDQERLTKDLTDAEREAENCHKQFDELKKSENSLLNSYADAKRLDGLIKDKEATSLEGKKALAKAKNEKDKAQKEFDDNKSHIESLTADISKIQNYLDSKKALENLANNTELISKYIGDYESTNNDIKKNANQISKNIKDKNKKEEELKGLNQKNAGNGEQLKQQLEKAFVVANRLTDLLKLLRINDASKFPELATTTRNKMDSLKNETQVIGNKKEELTSLSSTLTQVSLLIDDNQKHDENITLLTKEIQELRKNLNFVEDQTQKLVQNQKLAKVALAEAQIISKLQEYRNDLHDGKPCPLCGSISHDLNRITSYASLDINDCEKVAQEAEETVSKNSTSKATLKAQISSKEENLETEKKQYTQNLNEIERIQKEIISNSSLTAIFSEHKDLITIDNSINLSVRDEFNKFDGQVRDLLNLHKDKISELNQSYSDLYNNYMELNGIIQGYQEINKDMDKILSDIKLGQSFINEKDQNITTLENDQKDILAKKDEHITQIKTYWPEWTEAITSQVFKNEWESIFKEYLSNKKGLDDKTSKLTTCQGKVGLLTSSLKDSDDRLSNAQIKFDTSKKELSECQDKRKQIFDGDDADIRKNAFYKELEELNNKVTEKNKKKEELTNSISGINGKISTLETQKQSLTTTKGANKKSLDEMLASQGTTVEEYQELISLSENKINEDKKRIADARENKTKAEQSWELAKVETQKANKELEDAESKLPKESLNENVPHTLVDGYQEEIKKQLTDNNKKRDDLNHSIKGQEELEEEIKTLKSQHEAKIKDSKALRFIAKEFGAKDNAINNSAFMKYVQGFLFENLIDKANTYIQQYNQRYELQILHTEGSSNDLNFGVLDNYNSEQFRYAQHLSGGEKFMVALSLAIALSDMSGGALGKLENLFIDEGFGTLDSDNFNNVLNFLSNLGKGNRSIGIITHVEEAEEKIPAQIRVTPKKDEPFSDIEIITE